LAAVLQDAAGQGLLISDVKYAVASVSSIEIADLSAAAVQDTMMQDAKFAVEAKS